LYISNRLAISIFPLLSFRSAFLFPLLPINSFPLTPQSTLWDGHRPGRYRGLPALHGYSRSFGSAIPPADLLAYEGMADVVQRTNTARKVIAFTASGPIQADVGGTLTFSEDGKRIVYKGENGPLDIVWAGDFNGQPQL
jgi:hypothetical protein